ncbi:hypothetical protein ACLMJK_001391 [Lecanora helva]
MDSNCTFLKLLSELRVRIYREILCYEDIRPEVRPGYTDSKNRTRWWKGFPQCNPRCHVPAHPLLGGEIEGSRPGFEDYSREQPDVRPPVRLQLNTAASAAQGVRPCCRATLELSCFLNVLFACKQTYAEALPIFWSENNFIVDDIIDAYCFLKFIGSEPRSLLRNFGVKKTVYPESEMHPYEGFAMSGHLQHRTFGG